MQPIPKIQPNPIYRGRSLASESASTDDSDYTGKNDHFGRSPAQFEAGDDALEFGSSDLLGLTYRARADSVASSEPAVDPDHWDQPSGGRLSKQQLLTDFETTLHSHNMIHVHRDLRSGLLESGAPDDHQTSNVGKLFKNRSFYTRQCTRSGSLALAAFAFKVYGTNLLDGSRRRIDKDKLIAAMHTLFGKEMARISGDLVTGIRVETDEDIFGGYILSTGQYSVRVQPEEGSTRQFYFHTFVTTANVQPSHFYDKSPSYLSGLFREGDKVPKFIVESVGLKYQKTPKFSGDEGVKDVARLGVEMDRGDVMYESDTVKLSFIAACNPSSYSKVEDRFTPERPVLVEPQPKWSGTQYTVKNGAFVQTTEAAPTMVIHKHLPDSDFVLDNESGVEPGEYEREIENFVPADPSPLADALADWPFDDGASTQESQYLLRPNSSVVPLFAADAEPGAAPLVYDPRVRAMNAFKVEVTHAGKTSTFYGIASQTPGDLGQNVQAARLVVDGIFELGPEHNILVDFNMSDLDDPQFAEINRVAADPELERVLIDIRLYNEQFESGLYQRHTDAMQTACDERGVTYLPVFQEAHDQYGGAAGAVVAGFQPTSWAHPFTSGAGRQDKYQHMTIATIHRCFILLPPLVQAHYAPVLVMWTTLMQHTDTQSNASPLALCSQILTDVFQEHKDTTKKDVRMGIGCKSAENRTLAVVTGVVMTGAVVRDELNKDPDVVDLHRIITVKPTGSVLNYEALSTSEKLTLADAYDPSLMHASSRMSTGVATNLNDRTLKEFARGVDFVKNDNYFTVSA